MSVYSAHATRKGPGRIDKTSTWDCPGSAGSRLVKKIRSLLQDKPSQFMELIEIHGLI